MTLSKNNLSFAKMLIIITLTHIFFNCNSTHHKKKKALKLKSPNEQIKTQRDNNLSPKIDDWFKLLCTSTRFNGNVLVAKNGKVIYQNSYGYANYQNKDTLTLTHRFQTGSVSKTFTSMAIMILKERGLLNYKDNIKKYIPEFPYENITIELLLSHRSGLSNYNYFCDQYTDKETIIYNKDVVKLMIDSAPAPYFPPDYRFDYCNTNYILLASVVEKVSKKPFEVFMRDEVFNKAGMNSTRMFINGKQNRIYKAAIGYHFKWLEALPTYQDGVVGDKGIYTTIGDLWRWNLAIENNKLVTKETLQEAFQPKNKEQKGNKNYGFGWRLLTTIDSSQLIYHGGWWRGFNALFVRDIKNDAVYIILSNIHTRALYPMFQQLLGVIDPERYEKQLRADSLYLLQKNTTDSVNVDMNL